MNLILISILAIFCLVQVFTADHRLSTNVKPSFYSIKIHPNLDEEVFTGTVLIHVKVKTFVQSINLHSCDLNITKIFLNAEKLDHLSENNQTVFAYQFADYQLLKIVRVDKSRIAAGNYKIYIEYSGKFSKNDTGLFKGNFTNNNNTVDSYLVVTDLEPTHARQIFPCFDEPYFKARFQLTLVTPNSTYNAISNMPEVKKFNTSYGIVYKFQTSKPMSTYLLAFAITRYSYGELRGCVPIRVYSPYADNENSREVMEYANKTLLFYSEYTGYNYPLPKIDMVEYDRSQSTATENWGLITFDTGLLSNSTHFPYDDAQRVNVIAHEIAHFWFGNLVTNDWWDDVWLQEGFAVFMALKVEEHILDNDAIKHFSIQNLEDAVYRFESTNLSKPIVNYVESPTTIKENFNDIIYNKGAAVLQMIEMVLHPRVFQKAVMEYICRYAYKTASTNDFLSIIETYSPAEVNIRSLVESYVYQNKYPLIKVTEEENFYVLRQTTCCGNWSNNTESAYGYKWTIPVTFLASTERSEQRIYWFDRDMEHLKIPIQNETWIKFNYEQKGLYRMQYSEEFWNKFISLGDKLEIGERSHLLLEAIQLFDSNITSCDVALKYLKSFDSAGTLPVNLEALLIAFIKLEKLKNYDKDAHTIITRFFKNILRKVHKDDSFLLYSEYNPPEIKSKHVPETIELCIRWIKENL